MGFFAPPYEKMISWAPAYFQAPARLILPIIDATATELGVPKSGHRLFRTSVVGYISEIIANEDPSSWSAASRQRIRSYTRNAEICIPAPYRHLVATVVEVIYSALRQTVVELHVRKPIVG